ncbi:MAG: protein serine/threonine phosphatase [Edaphobacter sp.]|nr:protein serine/threonine phosphatase [Edaphobacter sp.]
MLSDRGKVRRGNEDVCAAAPSDGAFVVCDGMGGAAGGEVASHLAADTFLAHLAPPSSNGSQPPRPQIRLTAAIQAANQAVYQQARQSPQLSGMGTTLVALLYTPIPNAVAGPTRTSVNHPNSRASDPATLWLAHVGDSRCYRRRGGHLAQLTEDHSLVEEQLRAGQITPAQAEQSPMRNLITRAVGTQPTVEADIHGHHPLPGDLYLLASDGLTRELSDESIDEILSQIPYMATQSSLDATCKALIDAANAHGGSDNITVLVLAFNAAWS